ncbi:MAG: DMT family transporter [Azospirillaceae bacterium]|nr:DMT family transporter [Azospirillaceae bacterium]
MDKILNPALVVLFSIVWSSAFIVGKLALSSIGVFTLLTERFLLSAIILAPFCIRHLPVLFQTRTILLGLTLGLMNNALYLGLTFSALMTVRPELVVVVVSCAPFITMVAAFALGLDRVDGHKIAGTTLGFLGVVMISGIGTPARPDPVGLSFAIAGTVAFSLATVLFRGKARRLPIVPVNFWQSVAGVLALAPIAMARGETFALPSATAMFAISYLAIGVTIGGMALWLLLIRKSGAATASSYHLLNPFIGIVLSHVVFDRPIRSIDVLGAGLIALALSWTTRVRRRAASVR